MAADLFETLCGDHRRLDVPGRADRVQPRRRPAAAPTTGGEHDLEAAAELGRPDSVARLASSQAAPGARGGPPPGVDVDTRAVVAQRRQPGASGAGPACGCGTGRVAARLAALGYDCTGVDIDASMLAVARREHPELPWLLADLATLSPDDPALGGRFEAALAAGNVVPLLADGALPPTVRALAGLLTPTGLLVAGFGLDRRHLPAGCPVTSLSSDDEACAAAGLHLVSRLATWQGVLAPGDGYAVSVHAPAGIVQTPRP